MADAPFSLRWVVYTGTIKGRVLEHDRWAGFYREEKSTDTVIGVSTTQVPFRAGR